MMCAIGPVRFCGVAAKTEILLARLAIRPTAHAGAKFLQADDLGGFGLLADGRAPFRQAKPVYLTDDGVLGNAEFSTDDTGGQAFVPKGDEDADACRRPFF